VETPPSPSTLGRTLSQKSSPLMPLFPKLLSYWIPSFPPGPDLFTLSPPGQLPLTPNFIFSYSPPRPIPPTDRPRRRRSSPFPPPLDDSRTPPALFFSGGSLKHSHRSPFHVFTHVKISSFTDLKNSFIINPPFPVTFFPSSQRVPHFPRFCLGFPILKPHPFFLSRL